MTDFPCLFSCGTHVASTPPVAKGHDHKRNCAVRKRVSTLCYDFPLDYHFQCQIIQFIRTNSTSGLSIRMASCMPDTLTHTRTHMCIYVYEPHAANQRVARLLHVRRPYQIRLR